MLCLQVAQHVHQLVNHQSPKHVWTQINLQNLGLSNIKFYFDQILTLKYHRQAKYWLLMTHPRPNMGALKFKILLLWPAASKMTCLFRILCTTGCKTNVHLNQNNNVANLISMCHHLPSSVTSKHQEWFLVSPWWTWFTCSTCCFHVLKVPQHQCLDVPKIELMPPPGCLNITTLPLFQDKNEPLLPRTGHVPPNSTTSPWTDIQEFAPHHTFVSWPGDLGTTWSIQKYPESLVFWCTWETYSIISCLMKES